MKLLLLLSSFVIISAVGLISPSVAFTEMDARIVGGDLAAPGEFPYQVFIENIWNGTEILKCGGAVYNKDYVVTAAHCMYFRDLGTYANPKRVWITAGTNDLEGTDDDSRKFKQVVRVSEIIPHPNFEFKKFEGHLGTQPTYDIVLLKVYPAFDLNERIQPIPLAPEDYQLQGNGTVTGWGRPDPYGKWTKQMRKVDIPLVDTQECARLFKGYAEVNKDMICTGTKEGGVTPCNGDSGGPLACRYLEQPDKTFLCGIASFGPNRCPNYSVYTRVSSYVSWVKEVTQS